MMSVIIDQQETITLVFDFKAATSVLEAREQFFDFVEWNSQLRCESNDAECIAHIVLARHTQNRFAQLFATAINAKDRGEILQFDIGAAIGGVFGETK